MLTEAAYLQIDDGENPTATFEFRLELEYTTMVEQSFIMSGRGQFLREADRMIPQIDLAVGESLRRTGFTLDGGGGNWQIQLTFDTGLEDATWGDGSGGTGPANVTKKDASGEGVDPLTRIQVLQYWIARSRSDSFGQTRLHWGQWTDGSVGGASAGAFNTAMPVAVQDTNFEKPEDDTTSATCQLTLQHVAVFPPGITNAAEWLTSDTWGLTVPDYLQDP